MLYDDLTQEQKDILAAWERNLRGWINGIVSRGIIEARALDAAYEAAPGGVNEILGLLDAGQVVPNSSGIAGAHDLSTQEFTTLINGLQGFLTTYDTNVVRRVAAKAAGPTAGL